ncbi:hypothetical protein [Nocardia africana]|uniref:Acid stress chaperone HdeA n=1 Tax=Nocardia africana TaxID=134964 RepID=A0A378WUN6_9NOCA|nr:hypothetical protein [Nocardia africana]MCC3313691.1 hypothetical protein [Nocardia africana]SUA44928.1 Uncharacterised protein [Nocardia africana]
MQSDKIALAVIAGLATVTLCVSGCNKGGDTTCSDFLSQSQDKQNNEVKKMYNDKHGADPNVVKIAALRNEAKLYCSTAGHDGTKISDVPIS